MKRDSMVDRELHRAVVDERDVALREAKAAREARDAAVRRLHSFAADVLDLLGLTNSYEDETTYWLNGREVAAHVLQDAARSGYFPYQAMSSEHSPGTARFIADVAKARAASEGEEALKRILAAVEAKRSRTKA